MILNITNSSSKGSLSARFLVILKVIQCIRTYKDLGKVNASLSSLCSVGSIKRMSTSPLERLVSICEKKEVDTIVPLFYKMFGEHF